MYFEKGELFILLDVNCIINIVNMVWLILSTCICLCFTNTMKSNHPISGGKFTVHVVYCTCMCMQCLSCGTCTCRLYIVSTLYM